MSHYRMDTILGLFGMKKTPFTAPPKNTRKNNFSIVHPKYNLNKITSDSQAESVATNIINAYKKKNMKTLNQNIPMIQQYMKNFPQKADTFIRSRFNSTRSDLSNMTEQNIHELKNLIQRPSFSGGKRKAKTRKAKARKAIL